MDVLVIGGSGLVGTNLVKAASQLGGDVHATYRSNNTAKTDIALDKTDVERTAEVINRIDPDVVVDTAAFHAVDDCEIEREKAWAVNAAGTRNVAVAANDVDAHYVYLSTDYVFRGNPAEAPYTEDDAVSPVNYYAQTKYAGEQAAQIADTSTVLRPSVIYGAASSNFVTWALTELHEENEIDIVDDQFSTPTYAPDLANACLAVVDEELTGVFHATGPERLSRYEFTVRLAEVCDYDPELVSAISTEEFGQEAPRPTDSSLDSDSLYSSIDVEFHPPAKAFEKIYEEYRTAA